MILSSFIKPTEGQGDEGGGTGCSWKVEFFHNSLQPRQYRCNRPPKLSTQCECTFTPIGWYSLDNQLQPSAGEGERWQTFENSWNRTQYFINILYQMQESQSDLLGTWKNFCLALKRTGKAKGKEEWGQRGRRDRGKGGSNHKWK